MSLPVGVTTRTLSIGRPFNALGVTGVLRISVTPIFGGTAQRLVWSATGDTFEAFTVTPPTQTDPDGDTTESIDLPIVDQAGWLDGSGNAITGWSYQVTVTPSFPANGQTNRQKPYTKYVSPLSTSSSPIDIDKLPDGTVAAPTLAPPPSGSTVGVVVATVAGDGVIDDTAAIRTALTSAAATGSWAKVPPGSICKVSGVVALDMDVRLDLTGVTLVQSADAPILKATSTAANVLPVTATTDVDHTMPGGAATTRSTQVTVSSTTGYAKDDLVRIVSGDPIPNSNPSGGAFRPRLGEFARVGDLDATNLYLVGPLRDTYTSNVKVYRVPARVCHILGGTFDYASTYDTATSLATMAELNGFKRVVVRDTHINRAVAAGFTTQGCASGVFDGVTGERGRNVQPNQLGYGIVHLGSENIVHRACVMDGFRHGFTTGGSFASNNPTTDLHRFGRTSHITYEGCTARGSKGSGFDCHEEAFDITYYGCKSIGGQTVSDAGGSAFASRGKFIRYFGCHAEGGLTGWQVFSLYGPSSADTLISGCSARVYGAALTAIGNVSGTAGGVTYPDGDVVRVRVTNSRLESTTGAADIITRAQVAVDPAINWQTGVVTAATDFAVVAHGSDPNVARPLGVLLVAWLGDAEPVNATGYDFRIPATG